MHWCKIANLPWLTKVFTQSLEALSLSSFVQIGAIPARHKRTVPYFRSVRFPASRIQDDDVMMEKKRKLQKATAESRLRTWTVAS